MQQREAITRFVGFVAGAALAIGCSSNDLGAGGGTASGGGGAAAGAGGQVGSGGAGQGGDPTTEGSGGSTSSGGGAPAPKIKWNPGHYMASNSIVRPGGSVSGYELDHLDQEGVMLGYRMFVGWGALETAAGYDFKIVDDAIRLLKTKYATPKRLVLVVLPGAFASTAPGHDDGSMIPLYIQQSSDYGESPVGGRYGWWGGTGNGNTYAAALHRGKVMDRFTALHVALGARYDAEPYFEGMMFQEDSWSIGAASTNGCPDYTDEAMVTQYKSLLTATLAAFPHTNVIFENTWLKTPTAAQELEQWMIEHRVAPGTADTFGQTYLDAHQGHLNSWGLEAYMGVTADQSSWHGPDYRGKARAMLDVEAPDLGAYGSKANSPADIIQGVNGGYKASHLFWTYIEANSGAPESSLWPALTKACAGNPLTNIGYPENYP